MNVSWVGFAVAVVVGFAIANVWYGWAFVAPWRVLTGVTKDDSQRAGKRPFAVLVVAIVATALVLAVGCAAASDVLDNHSLWLDLGVGLVACIGFSLSTLLQHNAFELKPVRLSAINSAYQLVLFLGMALAIGLLD